MENDTKNSEETTEQEAYAQAHKDENEVSDTDLSMQFEGELNTHKITKNALFGDIVGLKQGYSKVNLFTTHEMTIDSVGLVHSGFIYSTADYAACLAINKENIVTIGAKISFFAPARVGDIVEFEANSRFEDCKKQEVHVLGKIKDVKVFEGKFQVVILDDHVFTINSQQTTLKKRKKANKSS